MNKTIIIGSLYSYILIIAFIFAYRLMFLSNLLPIGISWAGMEESQYLPIVQYGHFTSLDQPAYYILYAFIEIVAIHSNNLLGKMSMYPYLNPLGLFFVILNIILIMRKIFNNKVNNLSYLYISIIVLYSIFYNYSFIYNSYMIIYDPWFFIRLSIVLLLMYFLIFKEVKNYRYYIVITFLFSLVYLGYHTYAFYSFYIITGVLILLFFINRLSKYFHLLIINSIIFFAIAIFLYGSLLLPFYLIKNYISSYQTFTETVSLPTVGSIESISFYRVLSIFSTLIYLFILLYTFIIILYRHLTKKKLSTLELFILYFYLLAGVIALLFLLTSPFYLVGRALQPFELIYPFIFIYFFKSFIYGKGNKNLKRNIMLLLLVFCIFTNFFLSVTYEQPGGITYSEYSGMTFAYTHLQNDYKIFSDFTLGTMIFYYYFNGYNACWPFQNSNDQSSEFITGLYSGNVSLNYISNICNTDNWLFAYDIKYQTAPFFSTPLQALQPLPNDTLEKLYNSNLSIIFNNGMIILLLNNGMKI